MGRAWRLVTALWLLVAAAGSALADEPGQTAPPPVSRSVPRQSPDFFFGQPRGWFSIRGGLLLPRADAELFTFLSDTLTLQPSDFRSRTFDLELGFLLTPRFSIEGGVDLARRRVDSEYRNFVRATREPITQQTDFNQSGLTVGIRFSPAGHGRRVSSLSFLPRRMTPYGAAGLQATYYSFRQRGSFVDFADLSIFDDVFGVSSWTTGPYARAGIDIQLWRRLFANADFRYTWLRSTLSRDFEGFRDGLDLAGARTSTGISVKF